MKMQWTVLSFVAGLALGWMLRGNGRAASGAENTPPTLPERNRPVRPDKPAHASKWLAFGKKLDALTAEEKKSFTKNLAPADRIPAIEAIVAQSGPSGLDHGLWETIRNILEVWADEDFEAAWSWSQGITSDATRRCMMAELLSALVKKDPERALALHLEQAAADPNFRSSVPMTLLMERTRTGAAGFLELLALLPAGESCMGCRVEFAKDFDFQLAADGLAELKRKNGNHQNFAIFPMNFVSQWARNDPEAAFAWWSKNNQVHFNDLSSLLEGVEKYDKPGFAPTWLAGKLEEPGAPRDTLIRELANPTDRSASTINSIAREMPDTTTRDRFLTDLLVQNFQPMMFTLAGLSSVQARLDAFQEMKVRDQRVDPAKISDAQLQSWGVTRQQVVRIFQP